jgi:hypothetical protein
MAGKDTGNDDFQFSEEELASLTPEEREALQDDENSGEESDGADDDTTADEKDEVVEEKGDDEGETPESETSAEVDGVQGDDEEGAEDDADTVAADDEQPAAQAEKPQGREAPQAEETPARPADLETEPPEQGPSVAEQLAELDQKYEEGDLTLSEYTNKRDVIRDKFVIETAVNQAKSEMREEQAANTWRIEQEAFFAEHPEYGNEIRHGALASALEALYREPDMRGSTGTQYLLKAHENVESAFGVASVQEEETPKSVDKEKLDKAKARSKNVRGNKPDLSVVPKTLKDAPAADTNKDTDPFASLDNLEGLEKEAAVAKLSPSELDKYLGSG